MKKLIAMLLCVVLLASFVGAYAEDAHQLIYGASTEIGGDFSASDGWFTNNATDAMIRRMTDDTTTVVMNKEGAYIVNPTVAAEVEGVMNEDGTKTYTVKINDGLLSPANWAPKSLLICRSSAVRNTMTALPAPFPVCASWMTTPCPSPSFPTMYRTTMILPTPPSQRSIWTSGSVTALP